MGASENDRPGVSLPVDRWEFLIISALFVAIYIARETGAFGSAALRILDDVFIAVALAFALRAAAVSRRFTAISMTVAAVGILTAGIEAASTSDDLLRLSNAFSGVLVVVTSVLVFLVVVRQHYVSVDTVFGALAVYLGLGVLFGMIFTAVAAGDPSAFEPAQYVVDGESSLYYFSFVTLTSLGYGDIAPASDAVRVLATLETIFGLLLLAALVGWIVGLLVAAHTGSSTDRRLDDIAAAIGRLESDDDRGRSADTT